MSRFYRAWRFGIDGLAAAYHNRLLTIPIALLGLLTVFAVTWAGSRPLGFVVSPETSDWLVGMFSVGLGILAPFVVFRFGREVWRGLEDSTYDPPWEICLGIACGWSGIYVSRTWSAARRIGEYLSYDTEWMRTDPILVATGALTIVAGCIHLHAAMRIKGDQVDLALPVSWMLIGMVAYVVATLPI